MSRRSSIPAVWARTSFRSRSAARVIRVLNRRCCMPGQSGINNIRFQPYRMFNSRGHNTNDPRVSCLACHNPHEKLQKDAAYYDAKCLGVSFNQTEGREDRAAQCCGLSGEHEEMCDVSHAEG